jgi:hypothetical protein
MSRASLAPTPSLVPEPASDPAAGGHAATAALPPARASAFPGLASRLCTRSGFLSRSPSNLHPEHRSILRCPRGR